MTTLVEGEDYIFKEEKGEVWLTTKGAKAAENYLGIGNLYDEGKQHLCPSPALYKPTCLIKG